MKKLLINLFKLGISAAIITYVVIQARNDQSFAQFRDQPKDWGLLTAAWAVAMTAVCLTFVRWYILVRALELPFRMEDAFRLGFLGYLLNFISVGSVGGDLFKAVFIAREQRGRRTEAIATVIVDRMVGMYSLLLVASAGILLTGLNEQARTPEIELICRGTLVATVIGTVIVLLLLVPGSAARMASEVCRGLPLVGGMLFSLGTAIRAYRHKLPVLALTCLMSLGTHSLFTLTLYTIANGMPGDQPTLAQHFVVIPMGMAAQALPLPLGALGAFEYALDFLYFSVSQSQQGLVVALCYRLITVVIAMVGACFYLSSRREFAAVMHEAEAEVEEEPELPPETTPAFTANIIKKPR